MKKIFLALLLIVTCGTFAYGQRSVVSSRSKLGDLFGVPMKPYAGFGIGLLSFYGDLTPTTAHNWFTGYPAGRVNFSLEIGSQGLWLAHFNVMGGLIREQQNYGGKGIEVDVFQNSNWTKDLLGNHPEGHLNVSAALWSFGLMGEARLPYVIPREYNIRPYFAVGLSLLYFNPKSDRYYVDNGDQTPYDEFYEDNRPVSYDKKYETVLRDSNLYGAGQFSRITLGIPLEAGIDFRITPTVNIRLGTSFTFTLSDYIDGISGKEARAARSLVSKYPTTLIAPTEQQQRAARLQTNHSNDFFAYTYISFQFYLPFL
ncbi:MAG: hypothetical protein LBK47_08650 [Prevotellaceae bacterium]|jgi:hypothetical protein|nr:hypothetical protein [Prevotellaceae bacterium]